jgi:hypothetical protein
MTRFPLLLILAAASWGQSATSTAVKANNVTVEQRDGVFYVTPAGGTEDQLAILKDSAGFQNGTIALEMSGEPGAGSRGGARGFVGVAFRVAADMSRFECFYLRPTNGRAEDHVRRNHSTQYVSFPDYPWQRSRTETPEKYEAYVDLMPGEWTTVRITVEGPQARLYVHDNAQPTLVVNDLHAAAPGAVGLWVGPGTEARFRHVVVTKQ